MDTTRVLLIGAIFLIAYYLLLQWPEDELIKNESSSDNQAELSLEGSLSKELKDSNIIDSKDSLTSNSIDLELKAKSSPNVLQKAEDIDLFFIENNLIKVGMDFSSGRFLTSELKEFKKTKFTQEGIGVFGNRKIIDSDCEGARLEGALPREGGCLGNYYASSGFFSDSGYIVPNFKFIEKTSLGPSKFLYIFSGTNEEYSLVRRVVVSEDEYVLQVEDVVGLREDVRLTTKKVVPYVELVRDGLPSGSGGRFESYTYTGPVFSTESKAYNKISFSDLSSDPFQEDSVGGWFAFIQRYFLAAWVPDSENSYKFQARKTLKNNYSLALTGDTKDITYGSSASFKNSLYVGPKISQKLNKLHPDLGLVSDYGFLWFLALPMYLLLGFGYQLLGNWGFAILFATVAIRAVLWPLTAKSYKSMAKMRTFAPQIQELQAMHGNDKTKLAQETMALYKKEGVNPLGGCLPILLQLPFFIAFYWVLLDMVQLRHSPFIFWITDLSAKDPFYILPIVNGALMYYSQKFMPVTPSQDPTQQQMQQMMKYMPVFICIIFAWFPSAFVLYFCAQTLVQLFQQALNFRKEGVAIRSVLFK